MTWRMLSVAAIALGSAVGPATAVAADTEIAAVKRATEIRSWKGIGVFSVYDEKARVFRLALTRGGAAPQILEVAPRPVAFDADIGPDGDGRPVIVFSRCVAEAPQRRDCDIFRYSIDRAVESRIADADSDSASEFNPTIWGGRVAWVRTYDGRGNARPLVYTRRLSAPRTQRSQRMPGLPAKRCAELTGRCSSTKGAVEGLELHRRWLAINVSYTYEGMSGFARKEIRLSTLRAKVRRVADQIMGLGGQSYVGLSFDGGNLYWARSCAGDESACSERNSGAFRYRLSTRAYALAGHTRKLSGFSYAAAGRVYEVRGGSECGIRFDNPPGGGFPDCRVVLADPPAFAATRAPR